MRVLGAGLVCGGVMLGVSCSGIGGKKDGRGPLAAGMTVVEMDVRMGLTADDDEGGALVLEGEGFQKATGNSYVSLMADGEGSGTLKSGRDAMASGLALDSRNLQALVVARPGLPGTKSSAQAVLLSTTALRSTERLDKVRVEIETDLEAELSGGAVAICEVEGEARLDGHTMATIATKLYLYSENGQVLVFVGPRELGKKPLGSMANGERFTAKDPSFYFALGPGAYQILFTLKVSAICPSELGGGMASLKASGEVMLR
ncbi:MAG: hypothetical protein OSA48_08430 [Akkermansiaceae bacterium]|nr:hypothetical protein [Akkermansiaceae bacterium]